MESYDYVVIGGGTAGCVIAARLSEEGRSVLLLEAGPADPPAAVYDPLSFPMGLLGSDIDWAYTTVPQPGTGGQVHIWPRGKVLGGTGSINAMAHLRGHRSNYDGWAASGATGWSFADLLPYFKRSESTQGRDSALRGTKGPMQVAPPADREPAAEAFFQAVVEAGHPATDDISGADQAGAFWYELNVVDGKRQNSAEAYLRPVLGRPNLHVRGGAQVSRVEIDGGRCTSVHYRRDGRRETVRVTEETIVCSGTIGSAQLLLLSGIGPADHLRDLGIDVVADLPGVGQNLQDHVMSFVTYRASQPMHTAPNGFCTAGAILRSDPGLAAPDVYLKLTDFPNAPMVAASGPPPDLGAGAYSIAFSLYRPPASSGTIKLASADPGQAPLIDPNYYADEQDVGAMLSALDIARQVGQASALSPWRADELLPGPAVQDEAACRAYLRRSSGSAFHPVGTCRMGVDDLAVVSPDLRVRGIDGLRVADASIMPAIVNANTNATVLAIAERAAALIRKETA